MKLNSIRTKVVITSLCCLAVGLGGTAAVMRYNFNRDAEVLATQAVSNAQILFALSEAREISKMTAVKDTLAQAPEFGDALAARDRDRLFKLTAPLYEQLKKEGITNWMIHTAEPDRAVFLRLHNPAKFGDHLDRYIDRQVERTHAVVTGNELAKAGFAVRVISPVYSSHGSLAGYVEFGEELGSFIHTMKAQTGDDFGLLLDKKYLDRGFWAESSKMWHRRDDWDDAPNTVVLDKTTTSGDIFKLDGDLSAVSSQGRVLERYQRDKSVFVRGIFPIKDAAGHNIGAIFVVRDITTFYQSMQRTGTILVVLMAVAVLIGTALFLALLNHLIFKRLERIIQIATRVVGGDYETELKVTSDDEVGQFEQLFEQFRLVFLHVLNHVPELQEK